MIQKNIILGGGLSAAAVSFYLRDYNNIIYEKDKRINGRIQSREINNNYIEFGAQFFSKEDLNIYNLIKELSLEPSLQQIKLNDFSILHNGRIFRLKDMNSDELSINEQHEIKAFTDFIYNNLATLSEESIEELNTITFYDWYTSNIGDSSSWIINALVRAITFAHPTNLSAYYGLIVCSTFFDNCYTLKHGLETLNKILLQLSNPVFHTEKKIDSLEIEDEKITCLLFSDGDERRIGADESVISTIPSRNLSSLLPQSDFTKILDSIKYNSCAVTLIRTKEQLLNHGSGILCAENDGISIIIDEPKYADFHSNEGLIVVLLPNNYDKSDSHLLNQSVEQCTKYIPNLSQNIISTEFMNWEFGLPEASPAFFQLQQDLSMRHYKNFYVAGDYIGLPSLDACIESAKNVATAIKSVH